MQTLHRGKPRRPAPGAALRRWGRWLCAIVALVALVGMAAAITRPAHAQTYRFQVSKSTTDLYVNSDGTVSLDYLYVFVNDASADPIDAVDVGVPTSDYDLSSVSGSVDGQRVTSIEESPYVKPGVALNLGSLSIQPGATGEVRVHIGVVRKLIFKANTKEKEPYASFQFNPNYFGSDFVHGSTDMTVTLHLPQGLQQNEPRYFQPKGGWPGSADPDTSGYDDQNRVYYTWHATGASSSAVYTFGAAFPARLVPAAALQTENPFSGININFDNICPWLFCVGFLGFIGLTTYGSIVGDRKRKLQYLPPKIAVEGNGIKRGLTAPEAAVLMEQPMDKILTMVLFATLKKGAATVTSQKPMQIQVTKPAPDGLQPYELEFLNAMSQPAGHEQRNALQTMMTNLVKEVSEKMRGFSRKESVAYYQDIINRAWQQVQAANTPEMQVQAMDETMDWTMADRNYPTRSREVYGPRPVFLPMWWWRYDPAMPRPSAAANVGGGLPVSTSANRPPSGMSLPSLPGADFASSMVGGIQTFAASTIGDLTAFTGGVTNKTNPVPKSTYTSSGGGGGGGSHCACACACACAGCACACAGGGR